MIKSTENFEVKSCLLVPRFGREVVEPTPSKQRMMLLCQLESILITNLLNIDISSTNRSCSTVDL